MNEREVDKILEQTSLRGMKPGLERMGKLMAALGNPQEKFRSIHVTGSNGKGSLCAMLESILHCAGYRVGLYTSPHLVDLSERIRVNKENIPHPKLARWIKEVWSCAQAIQLDSELTYFELLTAVSFCYFAECQVEIAVVEVGLGGRLDATNVISSPEVCLITNISLEHTDILGKSVEKIAWEKAGIIKKNSICITAAEGSALKVIKSVCLKEKAHLYSVRTLVVPPTFIEVCSLKGKYQKVNLSLVLKAIEVLTQKGWEITKSNLLCGLQETFLQGRFQKMFFQANKNSGTLPVLLDGAHNPAAIAALTDSIASSIFRDKPCLLIFNTLKDKDLSKMVQVLTKNLILDQILIPLLDTERSNPPEKVAKLFFQSNALYGIQTFSSVKESWRFLSEESHCSSVAEWILVTGSLYLIGETLKLGILKEQPTKPIFVNEYVS